MIIFVTYNGRYSECQRIKELINNGPEIISATSYGNGIVYIIKEFI